VITGDFLSRHRWRLPRGMRDRFGMPCEGDRITCPHCHREAETEAVQDPLGEDGYALICGDCHTTIDYGKGMTR